MNERELLEHYRPWLRTVARNMLPEQHRRHLDDCAQEGWIAIWRARPDRYDVPADFILKQAAVRRMRSWYEQLVNAERGARRGVRVEETRDNVTIVTDFSGPGWDELCADLPEVELAYHHGQIAAALDRLYPRERQYVALRFWGGATPAMLKRHFGYYPNKLWDSARRKLAADLAHLAGVT